MNRRAQYRAHRFIEISQAGGPASPFTKLRYLHKLLIIIGYVHVIVTPLSFENVNHEQLYGFPVPKLGPGCIR